MQVLKPHISLNVTDIGASVAFYEKLFGAKPAKRRPGYAKFDLAVPSLNLAMMEVPRTGMNVSHFGIQVATTGDVDEAKARLEAAGLPVVSEREVSCCHAVQNKVWVADPDGNEWEVFVVLADIAEDASGRAIETAGAKHASPGGVECCAGSPQDAASCTPKAAKVAKAPVECCATAGAGCGPVRS